MILKDAILNNVDDQKYPRKVGDIYLVFIGDWN